MRKESYQCQKRRDRNGNRQRNHEDRASFGLRRRSRSFYRRAGWRTEWGVLEARFLHRAYESVPSTGQRFDITRSARGVSQHLANARDGVVQAVVKIDKGFCRPDFRSKLLSGE